MARGTDKLINVAIAGGIVYFGVQFINSGQLQPIIDQLKAALGGLGGGAATTPAPGGEAPTTGGACDCSCMPMDGDANRQKIETAAGEDCNNNIYFGPGTDKGVAECKTRLAEICAERGGGTTPPAGGGGAPAEGGDEEGGEEEEEEDEEEDSNYARISYYLMMRR